MKLHAIRVPGERLDGWTVAPLFVLDDLGIRPRPAAMVLADDLADADVAAFPCLWSAYQGATRRQARAELDRAGAAGIPVVVWVDGDPEVDLEHPAAILFEHGPDASRRPAVRARHAWPVLIHDHLEALYDGDLAPRPWRQRPTVGFCGQATASMAGRARLLAGKLRSRAAHRLGRTDRVPPPLRSHLALRRRVLEVLRRAPGVDTDFVVRDRYRAGVRTLDDRADRTHPTATAFFENLRGSDYTVCVRGGGNFSTRLYETLCLGRIPVIVDTDLVLPWEGRVPWHELAVRVPAAALDELPGRLLDLHAGFDDAAFAELQRRCRALWVDRLSVPGFFDHLPELLA